MSKRERVTLTDKKAKSAEASLATVSQKKNGKTYVSFRVRWKIDGETKTKEFKELPNAEIFKNQKNLELKGMSEAKQPFLSSLTKQNLQDAEWAQSTLGETYSIREAVEFFLRHHRPPKHTLTISEALKVLLDKKEKAGVSDRQRRTLKTTVNALMTHTGDVELHTITEEQVRLYLGKLKGRDGKTLKKKTWNNRRNEVSSFFTFAMEKDLSTQRPWTFHNPVEDIEKYSKDSIRQERPPIATSDPQTVCDLLTYAMQYNGGAMVKYFALAYFTGIRPSPEVKQGELTRLAENPSLINLETNTIRLHASMTKDKRERTVTIAPNLKKWLEAYEHLPIVPEGLDFPRAYRHIRQQFKLQHDETRHSFISYHVALNRSVGNAALEAGNSEAKVKEHYLYHRSRGDAEAFASIVPDMEAGVAVFAKEKPKGSGHLKVS